MRILAIQSGACSGVYNMALDEALLERVRAEVEPTLILRTYRWEQPTLSLGANQPVKDVQALLRRYGQKRESGALVRRPTGGRAILHGADISYAFISSQPEILKLSLSQAYRIYADLVQKALGAMGISAQFAALAGNKDYLRSPVCFETQTPTDLVAANGRKISGSAQLRRAGGILQHGAAFLGSYGVSESAFFDALKTAAEQAFQQNAQIMAPEEVSDYAPQLPQLQAVYQTTSDEILESASTTSGSHLLPDSF